MKLLLVVLLSSLLIACQKEQPKKTEKELAVVPTRVEEPPKPLAIKEEPPKLCVGPKFKIGDVIETVLSHPETGKSWKGQIVEVYKEAGNRNDACVYAVIHYNVEGESSIWDYWEFELKRQ